MLSGFISTLAIKPDKNMNYEKAKNKYHNSPAINQRWSLEEYINLLEGIGESVEPKSVNDIPVEEYTEVSFTMELENAIKVLGKTKVAEIIFNQGLNVVIPHEEDEQVYPSDHFGQDPVKQDV